MSISVFDRFSIGIGPSSSHTVGPMRAARIFVTGLRADGLLAATAGVRVELFGSLGATGYGHGSDKAVLLGLYGAAPESIDPRGIDVLLHEIRTSGRVRLLGEHEIAFTEDEHLVMHRRRSLPVHPNGMLFNALDSAGRTLRTRVYYSVGGGFVVDENAAGPDRIKPDDTVLPYPFDTAEQLLGHCRRSGLSISAVMRANERAWRTDEEIRSGLLRIWEVMQECVANGCAHKGVLPGGLRVRRRAPELARKLAGDPGTGDPLRGLDWVTLYALAVNEENAAGGPRRDRPDQRRGGHHSGGPALLHPLGTRRRRRRCAEVSPHRGRDRGHLQADRLDLRG